MLSISSCVLFRHLDFFLWKSSVSSFAQLFIGLLIFFWSLVFWVPFIFWLLIPYQMYSWQRSSPILWTDS
jgi:hypothetical protein